VRRQPRGSWLPSQPLLAHFGNVELGGDPELRVLRNGEFRTMHSKAREADEALRFSVMRHHKRETIEGKVPTASTH
jgi:hypothetical protein